MARRTSTSVLAQLLPLAWLAGSLTGPVAASGPNVKLESGLTINGFVATDFPSVNQFLGIPYAEPPLESLRWLPPQPYSNVDTPINATEMPPSCIQAPPFGSRGFYTEEAPDLLIDGAGQSEDCLTLSVWAPNGEVPYGGLPVLIWIYGGAFVSGGTDVPYQNPSPWVQRSKDLIVVALNYRLNVFGFPNAEGLEDQNLAMLDQRLAVEWVKSNIAKFGGDPDRLTLWGQSAGAASVDIYNFAWYRRPLVQGFIMDSGTAHLPLYSGDTNQTSFSRLAELANCSSAHALQTLDCLREVPARTVESIVTNASLSFIPIADEKIVFSDYTDRASQGLLSARPAIIGTNSNEGSALVPYDPAGINQTAADAVTLSSFFCPALETSQERLASGVEAAKTFRYYYSGNFSNVSPRNWEGAYHSAELPLLFGTYGITRGTGTQFEHRLSEAMQNAWRNFARDGVKSFKTEAWPEYLKEGGRYRFFPDGSHVKGTGRLIELDDMC